MKYKPGDIVKIFDSREWKEKGYDQPDGNVQFWHPAVLVKVYEEPRLGCTHPILLADIIFLHDFRFSKGHFLMPEVELVLHPFIPKGVTK